MIVDAINRWAETVPEKPALIYNGRSLSYREFAQFIRHSQEYFGRKKYPSEGVAVVLGGHLLDSWVQALALRQLGFATVAVPTRQYVDRLGIRRPACLVAASLKQRLYFGARYLLGPTVVMRSRGSLFSSRGSPGPAGRSARPGFGDQLLFTSRTVGTDTMVAFRGSDQEHVSRSYISACGIEFDTVFNLHGVGPWGSGLGGKIPPAVWEQGGTVVFDDTDKRFVNLFEHGTNAAYIWQTLAPQLEPLIASRRVPAGPCRIFTGGGSIAEAHERTLLSLPNCSVTMGFSSTELAGFILVGQLSGYPQDGCHWLAPASGRVLEIVDDRGEICEPGRVGQLRVRLEPWEPDGYLNDPAASRRCFRGGYFYTGNTAVRRADGYFAMTGRTAQG